MNLSHKEVDIYDMSIIRICQNCTCDAGYIDCTVCIFDHTGIFIDTMQKIIRRIYESKP